MRDGRHNPTRIVALLVALAVLAAIALVVASCVVVIGSNNKVDTRVPDAMLDLEIGKGASDRGIRKSENDTTLQSDANPSRK
jgi:hypothetical protein